MLDSLLPLFAVTQVGEVSNIDTSDQEGMLDMFDTVDVTNLLTNTANVVTITGGVAAIGRILINRRVRAKKQLERSELLQRDASTAS